MPIILALRRLRKDHEFETSQGCIVSFRLSLANETLSPKKRNYL
jgi:hypothetical protein